MTLDPYETLQVNKDATKAEIKKAFRKRAKQTHPDKDSSNNDEAFKRVNFAYQLLIDDNRRERYDKTKDTSDSYENDFIREAQSLVVAYVMEATLQEIQSGIKIHIFSTIKSKLRNRIEDEKKERKKINKALEKLEEIKKRFVYKHINKEDILDIAMNAQIESFKAVIYKSEQNEKLLCKCLEILDSYSYKQEFNVSNNMDIDMLNANIWKMWSGVNT